MGKRWDDPEYVSELLATEDAPERVKFWRSPVFGEKFSDIPAFLLPRLAELVQLPHLRDLRLSLDRTALNSPNGNGAATANGGR